MACTRNVPTSTYSEAMEVHTGSIVGTIELISICNDPRERSSPVYSGPSYLSLQLNPPRRELQPLITTGIPERSIIDTPASTTSLASASPTSFEARLKSRSSENLLRPWSFRRQVPPLKTKLSRL